MLLLHRFMDRWIHVPRKYEVPIRRTWRIYGSLVVIGQRSMHILNASLFMHLKEATNKRITVEEEAHSHSVPAPMGILNNILPPECAAILMHVLSKFQGS